MSLQLEVVGVRTRKRSFRREDGQWFKWKRSRLQLWQVAPVRCKLREWRRNQIVEVLVEAQ